jgi:hypothetical protein
MNDIIISAGIAAITYQHPQLIAVSSLVANVTLLWPLSRTTYPKHYLSQAGNE